MTMLESASPMSDEPAEPLDTPDDDGGEIDPVPVHPIEPPGPRPRPIPVTPSMNDTEDNTGVAQFRVRLREAASEAEVQEGLSAEYVEDIPLRLPLNQRSANFRFAVEPDPCSSVRGQDFLVSVAGARGVVRGDLIILLVNVSAGATRRRTQAGVGLGRLGE